jgi:hypothetical protein
MFYVLYPFVTCSLTLPRVKLISKTEFGPVKLTTTYSCEQNFVIVKTARLLGLDWFLSLVNLLHRVSLGAVRSEVNLN